MLSLPVRLAAPGSLCLKGLPTSSGYLLLGFQVSISIFPGALSFS